MRTLTNWTEFLGAIEPFLTSPRPLEALKQAGFRLGDTIAEAFQRRRPLHGVGPAMLERLERTDGPAPRPRKVARRPRGYRATASADMTVLNEILAELWRVGTIPQTLDDRLTADVITIDDLGGICPDVPDGATLGNLRITSPPVASASRVSPRNIHFAVGFLLPLPGSLPAYLEGAIHAELPLDFQIVWINDERRIRLTLDAIDSLTVTVDVGLTSTVRPKPDGGLAVLAQSFATALQRGLRHLIYDQARLTAPAATPISSRFPNSRVTITQVGMVTVRSGGHDYVIAGVNVDNVRETDSSALVAEELPVAPHNVHGAIDQDFATDALSAVIESGDLAAFFNRVVARHLSSPFGVPIVLEGGRVAVEAGVLRVSVDCVLQGAGSPHQGPGLSPACAGAPVLKKGALTIASWTSTSTIWMQWFARSTATA